MDRAGSRSGSRQLAGRGVAVVRGGRRGNHGCGRVAMARGERATCDGGAEQRGGLAAGVLARSVGGQASDLVLYCAMRCGVAA